jgi:hypothetical protein
MVTTFMVWLLWCITFFSDFFANLPGAYPAVRIGVWQCVGLYALVLLLAGWLLERWAWARNGTVAMAAALLLSWGWSAHERNHLARFIIYDERGGLTCGVESGRSLIVFTDTLDEWMARRIDRHQRAIGAYEVETRSATPSKLAVGGISVMFTGADVVDTARSTKPDLVVLTDDARYDMDRIRAAYGPLYGFVLAPTISAKRRAYLRHWCAEHDVPVHDVREQGAYVRDR